ncbi:GNAT family N-acetyltransferase [Piscinibacter sp. XHJ-5]|uniref:GNAT family N-acetyltransferase n=1 Tax=Piscinibacter sp. XHJ-5 TaxID=3037797 RepID=UPI002452A67F|nr:GNAT family N-acetyltransferase [Piscinibacter sp. XHJ-5]
MTIHVRHNPRQSRFEAEVEGHLCVADYRLHDRVIVMTHTEVPEPVQGRGIAARLVSAALAHAREHGLRVDAQCSYARHYMRQHPETQSLSV